MAHAQTKDYGSYLGAILHGAEVVVSSDNVRSLVFEDDPGTGEAEMDQMAGDDSGGLFNPELMFE